MKKNVILADCSPEGLQDFLRGFNAVGGGGNWLLLTSVSNWGRTKKFANLRRYIKYFTFPFGVFLHRKEYEKIIGWQQFYALSFCFFCGLFHVKKRQTLIAALNFTYKRKPGMKGKIYKWFMIQAVATKYLDYVHVPSYDYATSFSTEFGFPRDRILVCPFGVDDNAKEYAGSVVPQGVPQQYALAIGRSNRDYAFLVQAWRNIALPLVVVCDAIDIDETRLPGNVQVLKTIWGKEQYPLIMNCTVLLLALKDGAIPSGDTVLLRAMSYGKTVVVTKPSTIAEMYITDGDNGILINKTAEELEQAIREVLNGKDTGVAARRCYEDNYSQRAMGERICRMLP